MRVLFLSTNTSTGASEDLWLQSAIALKDRKVLVAATAPWTSLPSNRNFRVLELLENGIPFYDISSLALQHRVPKITTQKFWPSNLRRIIGKFRPNLIVISNGSLVDCAPIAKTLSDTPIPYITLDHGIFESGWPSDLQALTIRPLYKNARVNCFVSHQSLELAERQLAAPLPRGLVVRNPYLVDYHVGLPWPKEPLLRLACVGRLLPRHKGQDLLLQLLAMPKWRERQMHVNLFGSGPSERVLSEESDRLGLSQLTFCGYSKNIETIWESHHALILPSRQENLPLTIVEAMLCARPVIATDVGGISEIVRDNQDGFIASSPTLAALDEALERAWKRRTQWKEIGLNAQQQIRSIVPAKPAAKFADFLESLFE